MSPVPPVNAAIEIDVSYSCNDCCGCFPWGKKKDTPKGSKALEKKIIDQKIQEFQKNHHESYHKPKTEKHS